MLVGVAIALLVCEAAVRMTGRRPWNAEPWTNHVRIEPGGRFFTKHPTLGYSHLPGSFVVTLARRGEGPANDVLRALTEAGVPVLSYELEAARLSDAFLAVTAAT